MADDETVAARLAEIDARVEAATPGPWVDWMPLHVGAVDLDSSVGHKSVCRLAWQEDAAFIAHARTDIPWLRTQLDAMRERAEKAEQERDAALAYDALPLSEWPADARDRRHQLERAEWAGERDEARSSLAAVEAQLAALVEAADRYKRADADIAASVADYAGRADHERLSAADHIIETLTSLAPTAKARDERLVAAERARADAWAEDREAISAALPLGDETPPYAPAVRRLRARADAAEARCAMVSEAATNAVERHDDGHCRAVDMATLAEALSATAPDVAAFIDRIKMDAGIEIAEIDDIVQPFAAARMDARVATAEQAGYAAGYEQCRKDLGLRASVRTITQAKERVMSEEYEAGFRAGIEAAAKVCEARAAQMVVGPTPMHWWHPEVEARQCATQITALSPHPAAPSPSINLSPTDSGSTLTSPAQPVAVGSVEESAESAAWGAWCDRVGQHIDRRSRALRFRPEGQQWGDLVREAIDETAGPPPVDRELLELVALAALRGRPGHAPLAAIIDSALAEHGKVRR